VICTRYSGFRPAHLPPNSPGTRTNVIFFTKGRATERVWIYDARTNVATITKKDRPLTAKHFEEFERCFGTDPTGRAQRSESDSADDRWRSFTIGEVTQRGFKLDSLKWLRDTAFDEATQVPEPEELATDAVADLEVVVEALRDVLESLNEEANGVGGSEEEGLPEGWASAPLQDSFPWQRPSLTAY
jgi:type I restriction enzyme M protein